MRYFHKQQNHFWKPVINLDKVHTPISSLTLEMPGKEVARQEEEKATFIRSKKLAGVPATIWQKDQVG
jgi:hypothetical protein